MPKTAKAHSAEILSAEPSFGTQSSSIVRNNMVPSSFLAEIFDFSKIMIPVLTAIVAWLVNEHSKRRWEEYQRKEVNYRALLTAMGGFYVGKESREVKQAFVDQLKICWLYCPDGVILKAYAFLEVVSVGSTASKEQIEGAASQLVLAIRLDLISRRVVNRTRLQIEDYKHIQAV